MAVFAVGGLALFRLDPVHDALNSFTSTEKLVRKSIVCQVMHFDVCTDHIICTGCQTMTLGSRPRHLKAFHLMPRPRPTQSTRDSVPNDF